MKKPPVDLERLRALAGGLPANPIGSCFDSTGFQFVNAIKQISEGVPNPPTELRAVHGIGIANMPGQEGLLMAHAWLEFRAPTGEALVLDCLWNTVVLREKYHSDFKVRFCVKYTFEEFMGLWTATDYPGPWHPKLLKLTEGGDE